jgi:hypothetical protein
MTDGNNIEQCVAAEAIRQTLSRYCRYVDKGDSQLLSELFHKDAEYLPMAGRSAYCGPLGVQQFFVDLQTEFSNLYQAGGPRPPRLKHHLAQPDIQAITEDFACIETRFSVYSDLGLDHIGYYCDRLSPHVSGDWLFDSRVIVLDWIDSRSVLNILSGRDSA